MRGGDEWSRGGRRHVLLIELLFIKLRSETRATWVRMLSEQRYLEDCDL